MKTIFSEAEQKEILRRLEKLSANTPHLWGKMDGAQMLAHCVKHMQVPTGDLVVERGLLYKMIGGFFKKSQLSEKPFNKNGPTVAAFKVSDARTFEIEKQNFKNAFNMLAKNNIHSIKNNIHPFFGALTPEEWGIITYKQIDHHFRQFGV